MVYGSRMGLIPEVHPILGFLLKVTNTKIPFYEVIDFVDYHRAQRIDKPNPVDREDFLAKLFKLRDADKITDTDFQNTLAANIGAGAGTTAIALATVIYHLSKDLKQQKRLQTEIDQYFVTEDIADTLTFKQAQNMPYLQAVIKEALRIHPVIGQLYPRIVPSGGAHLSGQYFPAGVSLDCSCSDFNHLQFLC